MLSDAAGSSRSLRRCIAETPDDLAADPECRVIERTLRLDDPLPLDDGSSLTGLQAAVRLVGPPGAPVVAVLGGISASRRAVMLPNEAGKGWWQNALGADGVGLAERYRVLAFDWLGGAGDTTGPSHWPGDEAAFPAVSTRDQARLLARLLEALDIERLAAIVSASYGGMVSQHFAVSYPGLVERIMVIGCAHRPEPMATARRQVQKRILELAGDDEAAGLSLARALAMTTYRSPAEFRTRFGGQGGQAQLAGYLQHQGEKFARVFDREAYLRLIDSIDGHEIDPADINVPIDLLGFSTDELCPPELFREFAGAAPRVRRSRVLDTDFGHDAFLCEAERVAAAIDEFLEGDSP